MKIGLEGGHQRNLRQLFAQQPHGRDVRRIVRRGDAAHLFHRRQHVGRDPLHAAVSAAVDRLEADGRHFRRIAQAAVRRIGQLRQAVMHRLDVIGRLDRQLPLVLADLDVAAALRRADPFDASARELPPSSMSNSRYLKLVEPRLATRIFMRGFSAAIASADKDMPTPVYDRYAATILRRAAE